MLVLPAVVLRLAHSHLYYLPTLPPFLIADFTAAKLLLCELVEVCFGAYFGMSGVAMFSISLNWGANPLPS